MSIYVRPVREQIEHDRVIRHLQTKLKRKYEVSMNVGPEQTASVKAGPQVLYPDLVLLTPDKSRKLAGIVEVETGESVHHLEAMAQWAPFGRLKVPFQLYVPMASADIAKRLASDLGAHITELWTYHAIGDQIRLALVQKSPIPGEARRKADRERAAGRRAEVSASKKGSARSKAVKKVAKAAKSKPGSAKRRAGPARKPAARKPAARKPAPKAAARAAARRK